MNAVEIGQAVSELAERPLDREEFPFQLLAAFGNKDTTLKRPRTGVSNKLGVGGVLRTNNIHITTCTLGHPRLGRAERVFDGAAAEGHVARVAPRMDALSVVSASKAKRSFRLCRRFAETVHEPQDQRRHSQHQWHQKHPGQCPGQHPLA